VIGMLVMAAVDRKVRVKFSPLVLILPAMGMEDGKLVTDGWTYSVTPEVVGERDRYY